VLNLKTAVLLHTYNVNETNWKDVVWGVPPDRPGRIPMAIAVALEEDAEYLILFGSSIGKVKIKEREEEDAWISSGAWMAELMRERFYELAKFTILEALRQLPIEEVRHKIDAIYELIEEPERPANTFGELQAVFRIVKERSIQKLICVSSADHVSRIIRDAHKVFKGQPIAGHLEVRGSSTLYTENDGITPPERASVDHVVVAEPRAAVVPYFERMFGIGNNPEALAEIDTVLKKYGK